MTAQAMSPAQANFKLALWQADADTKSSSDLYLWLTESELPYEVAIRLHELLTFTRKVNDKVLSIGKIVLVKIIEFVQTHQHLVVGAGIGALVGAAVFSLITSIPFLGPLLAPVATALGIGCVAVGAIAGHRLAKRSRGQEVDSGIIGIAEDAIEVATEFFKLFTDVFNIIFQNIITA